MIEIRQLGLPGVCEIIPARIGDARGFFSETYSGAGLAEAGVDLAFVQDNHSLSRMAGVLRGLHYQLPPLAQDKLLRVTRGAIRDVVVDIRKSSPTYGKWLSLEVSADRWNQILVPSGYAHGFVTLIPDTEVLYKVTNPYSKPHERSIRFDDPHLKIDWGMESKQLTLSDKDRNAPLLVDAETFD